MTSTIRRAAAALCPLLLGAFPVLSLFAQNQTDVELSLLWPPLGVAVGATLLLLGVLLVATRSAAKASVLASLFTVAFFYYGAVFGSASTWWLLLWVALLAALATLVARTGRDLTAVVAIVGVAAAVLAVPQVASIASYAGGHPSLAATDPRLWPTPLAPLPAPVAGSPQPDIYVIVPDDYARADVLQQFFHFDDGPFLSALRSRGFVVSPQSVSPYSDSESNIAALVNLDYLTRFPAVLGRTSQDVRPVKRVIEDNRAARLLQPVGYRYVHLDTDEVTFAGGNPAISPLAPPDSFMNLWLTKSILGQVGGPIGFNDAARNARFRDSIDSQFRRLDAVAASPGPKFVLFHTLLPHDPYVLDARGAPVTFAGHSDQAIESSRGRAAYLAQLQYLNTRLLTTIDAIRAHSATPPVIVIQSDEGFQANPDVIGEAQMANIRVRGFSAFLMPGHSSAAPPSPPNSVNDLRVVLDEYAGAHYPMLPSTSSPEGDYPYQYSRLPTPARPTPAARVSQPAAGPPALIWTPRRLASGLAAYVRSRPESGAVAVVANGTQWSRQPSAPAGMAYPLDVSAADPRAYAAAVPAVADAMARLRSGGVILSRDSARLRGLGIGDHLRLGARRFVVRAVVPDAAVGYAEAFVSAADGRRLGLPPARYLLDRLTASGSWPRLAAAVRRWLPAGTPARLRAPGSTPFLREADAVLPPLLEKLRYGEFAADPHPSAGGYLSIDPRWRAAHLQTARVPILGAITCNRAFLPEVRAALQELLRRGLSRLVDPHDYGGCWAPRLIPGQPGASISHHAYGSAIDLNVRRNPLGAPPSQDPRLVDVLARHAMTWGGRWLQPDGMHFEGYEAPPG